MLGSSVMRGSSANSSSQPAVGNTSRYLPRTSGSEIIVPGHNSAEVEGTPELNMLGTQGTPSESLPCQAFVLQHQLQGPRFFLQDMLQHEITDMSSNQQQWGSISSSSCRLSKLAVLQHAYCKVSLLTLAGVRDVTSTACKPWLPQHLAAASEFSKHKESAANCECTASSGLALQQCCKSGCCM